VIAPSLALLAEFPVLGEVAKKHKQPGKGFTHYPDEYLSQKLGLIRLPMLPQNLPWAKA
jgi:RNA-directed DNA polymerase